MSRKIVTQSARPSEGISKILVACFSRSGHILSLPFKSTERLAVPFSKLCPHFHIPVIMMRS